MRRLVALGLVLGACVSTPAPSRTPSAAPATASASATPSAVAASPTPSPTPTRAQQNIRLGIVLADPSPPFVIRLRTESDATPFATRNGLTPTVSPDGTRLAYWRRDAGAPATRDTLHVLDLLDGNETEITALNDLISNGVAWRDDGGGLLYAARATSTAGIGADPPPAFTMVSTYAFATRQIADVKKLEAARFYPLAWSLAAHVVSGFDSGEGGVRKIYRFKEDGTTAGDTPAEEKLQEVTDASKDVTLILTQYSFFTGGRSFSGVRTFSAIDPSPIAEHQAGDAVLIRARFRPATRDILALVRSGDPLRYALEIWSGPGLATVARVWTGPAASLAGGELLARTDGKAAYVRTDPSGSTGSLWQIVDLGSGSATSLPLQGPVASGPWSSFIISDEGIAKLRR
jgi:hypothetical protein